MTCPSAPYLDRKEAGMRIRPEAFHLTGTRTYGKSRDRPSPIPDGAHGRLQIRHADQASRTAVPEMAAMLERAIKYLSFCVVALEDATGGRADTEEVWCLVDEWRGEPTP